MKLTLNALFDYNNDDGIFKYLNSYDVPWKSAVDYDLLDLDYHSKHGTKVVSKTVTSLLTTDGLSSTAKNKLAKLLYYKNKVRWEELWNTLASYDDIDPLANADWTETRQLGHSGSDSRTQNIGRKENSYSKGSQSNNNTIGSQTFTQGAQQNTQGQQSNNDEETKSAFNSSTYQPNIKNIENLGARSDSIGERQDTNSSRSDSSTEGARQDTSTEGAQQNSESGTNAFTDNETITKHGNIGVTMATTLLDSYRTLVNWQFFETIYKDIDAILVIEVYGNDNETLDDYTLITNYVLPIASASVLGGIKVGHNLSIDQDGTLNAQAEAGDVQSVNGKTGVVTIDNVDVGSPSNNQFNALTLVVNGNTTDIGALQTALASIRQVPSGGSLGQILKKLAEGYGWGDVSEVPNDGTIGQFLKKLSANSYGWADAPGGASEKYFDIFTDLANGRTNVGYAMRMDNKTSEIYVACTNNDDIQRQAICPTEDWKDTYLARMCGNQARIFWDGKIAFLSSSNDNNANINKYVNIFMKSSNSDYINDVTTVNLEYKDVAQAEYVIDLGKNVKHFAACCRQYNSFNNYKPSLYYTDSLNVEHDITQDADLQIHDWDNLGIISYDFPDNTYVVNIRVVFTGYRTKGTAGYY